MEQYLEKGKEVLKVLLNNGCEAYMIGEAVCRVIMGLPFEEIDITTNATPDMVKGIFANTKVEDLSAGSVLLTYMGYTFRVRTFRLEEKFKDNRKPIRLHYSKNLKDELAACDFTINAIALSYGHKLTDAYKGYDDILKKRIRTIGSPKVRFREDPLRILIGIRLASELGFKIEAKTFRGMRRRAKLLANVEPALMEAELKKIFTGKYFKRAIRYLVDTNAYKYIKDLKKGLAHFANYPKKKSVDTILACSYVLNKKYSPTWDNLSDDPNRLRQVVELALKNPRSKNDPYLLFKYGLEVSLDSNYVMYLLKRTRNRAKKIKKQYDHLPIKSLSEVNFTRNDFLKISRKANPYIDTIYKDVITKILKGELANDYTELRQYVIKALQVYNIYPGEEEDHTQVVYKEYDDIVYGGDNNIEDTETPRNVQETVQEQIDVPTSTLEQIQRKVSEFEKTLREKDERIRELERQALEYKLESDVNVIVDQNLELLKDLNYLEKGSERLMLSRELKEIYKGLIKNVDPKYQPLKVEKEGNSEQNESEN